ncbi:3TM-type holin [Acidocella sp.]|uniref:3TM-type holin n=1 Tax=Acidocella sp. TaxID=50710 RepID=UPI00260F6DD4|nr:3TM-type holin [Acidocella sp.]
MPGLIDLGSAIAPIVNKVLDFIPDPAQKAEAQAQAQAALLSAQLQMAQGQLDVDKAEAANADVFVAGWRPFIGWVCGAALAYEYIASPFLTWGLALVHPSLPPLPSIDSAGLSTLTFSLLGMGAMRTIEKVQGVAAKGAK